MRRRKRPTLPDGNAREVISDRALQGMISRTGLGVPAGDGGNITVAQDGSDRPCRLTIMPVQTEGRFEALTGDRDLVGINDP